VACREALRAFTLPAIWMAPENSSSFSVSVVLPASGCEMMANVRRRRTCGARSADMGAAARPEAGERRSRDYRGPPLHPLSQVGAALRGLCSERPITIAGEPLSPELPARLRQSTHDLHTQTERSGLMADLLAGRITRTRYIALLFNLHALYAALEAALAQQQADPAIAMLQTGALQRTAALASDLQSLQGAQWQQATPCNRPCATT
jgi:hypothetical protein